MSQPTCRNCQLSFRHCLAVGTGSLEDLEHVITVRQLQEAPQEDLEDVEVVTRQDMEEPGALEEVRL